MSHAAIVCEPSRSRSRRSGSLRSRPLRVARLPARRHSEAANAQDIPRPSDGKPDFTGVWAGPGFEHTGKDTDSATVMRLYTDAKMASIKPEGKSLLQRRTGNVRIDDPHRRLFAGRPDAPDSVAMCAAVHSNAESTRHPCAMRHFFRVIPFGAPDRAHCGGYRADVMGDSIAWWDERHAGHRSRCVSTSGCFDAYHPDDGDRDGTATRRTSSERIKFTGSGLNASYDVTIDDPAIFTAPWVENWSMQMKPTWKIFEFICDDNDRCRGEMHRLGRAENIYAVITDPVPFGIKFGF